jgi:transposase InsO family protein
MGEKVLSAAYYRPGSYWRGRGTIKKLASAAKVSEAAARDWLKKQTIWQIYLPAPRHIPRPMFDEDSPNAVHQADLLYLPHDRVGRKTYRYALTVVDVASRYKEAEALTDKSAAEVAAALGRIYKRGPLTWPRLMQVDPGREFLGAVNQLLAKHNTQVRRGRVGVHRDQGIVERFNRTLAERLFGSQYAQELLLAARGSSERSREWVRALPAVVAALNDEPTRLTGKKPSDAIKAASVARKPSTPAGRVVGLQEPTLNGSDMVRYLYQPGELEGGRRRATDPVWSLTIHTVRNVLRQPGQPALYYLNEGAADVLSAFRHEGATPAPARGFVREELLIIPLETELPPSHRVGAVTHKSR